MRRRIRRRPTPRPVLPEAVPFLAQAEKDLRAGLAQFGATHAPRWYMELMIAARAEELARLAKPKETQS